MSLLVDIEKKLGNFTLKMDLKAEDEVVSLLGASGCGKSMTLKCIAGFERPDRGRIIVDGETLFDSERRINIAPQKRRTGLMFQNYALFPNMTVEQNIYAGTKRETKNRRKEKTREIMEKFDLLSVAGHLPSQLSGGQQQRTALARILVSDPRILMLDEPFSALDSHLRFRMEQEVGAIIREFGKTVLMVSHDRDEVFRLSDKIAVMNHGNVDVFGSRDDVFADPKTLSACILTGCKNISPIRKIDEHHVLAIDWGMELETQKDVGTASYIGIRHHYANGDTPGNRFLCDVTGVIENPFSYTVMLRLKGNDSAGSFETLRPFGWEVDKALWEQEQSDQMEIHVPPEAVMLLRE